MRFIEQSLRETWHLGSLLLLVILTTITDAETPITASSLKRVEIDKTNQTLRAYEGEHLVLETRISSGRGCKWTPNGHFQAGDKQLMHYSRLFHHAPMPFSVQVIGNIFIHGFAYVPAWPASHGCIRVPLDGDNPARQFYEWVDIGTPIDIFGQWTGHH